PERQPDPERVVDQLDAVVVLVTGLVLEEIGEVIAGSDLERRRERVGQPQLRVRVALREVDGAALLAQAVDTRQRASENRRREPPARRERVSQPQSENRDRQLLACEVFGIAIHLGLETDERQPGAANQARAVSRPEQ